jgi:hypothetical protein
MNELERLAQPLMHEAARRTPSRAELEGRAAVRVRRRRIRSGVVGAAVVAVLIASAAGGMAAGTDPSLTAGGPSPRSGTGSRPAGTVAPGTLPPGSAATRPVPSAPPVPPPIPPAAEGTIEFRLMPAPGPDWEFGHLVVTNRSSTVFTFCTVRITRWTGTAWRGTYLLSVWPGGATLLADREDYSAGLGICLVPGYEGVTVRAGEVVEVDLRLPTPNPDPDAGPGTGLPVGTYRFSRVDAGPEIVGQFTTTR